MGSLVVVLTRSWTWIEKAEKSALTRWQESLPVRSAQPWLLGHRLSLVVFNQKEPQLRGLVLDSKACQSAGVIRSLSFLIRQVREVDILSLPAFTVQYSRNQFLNNAHLSN